MSSLGFIYVEGPSEKQFVDQLLKPHFQQWCNLTLQPIVSRTKRTAVRTFTGGITSYARIRKEIHKLLRHSAALFVTTMIDFYGLPKDFPGLKQLNTLRFATPEQRVLYLENEFAKNINNNRFIPFLTLHEFETFVLVDPDQLEEALPQYPSRAAQLKKQIGNTPPEEINDGSATHPAARIIAFFPAYKKALHGPLIAQRIGLSAIRNACPHFHQWLQTLEQRCVQQ